MIVIHPIILLILCNNNRRQNLTMRTCHLMFLPSPQPTIIVMIHYPGLTCLTHLQERLRTTEEEVRVWDMGRVREVVSGLRLHLVYPQYHNCNNKHYHHHHHHHHNINNYNYNINNNNKNNNNIKNKTSNNVCKPKSDSVNF